ncbi:hypothetical protein ACFLYA_00320 [Candidatus Dependentiae bacterium]
MNVLTKQKKLSLLAFLISILCFPIMYSSQKGEEDDRKVELVSKDTNVKRRIERKYAIQSGLIKDMLEEQDEEDEDIPSIPVPNVEGKDLPDIIELMQKGWEDRNKKGDKKKLLAEFIEEKNWNLDKLISLLLAANYLDAQLILKALAYAIANKKINKEILVKLPYEILFEIQAQYMLRHERFSIHIFDDAIIKDLKEKNDLYEKALKIMKGGKFVIIYYDDKDKIQLGDVKEGTVEIFKYIPKFKTCNIAIGEKKQITLWSTITGKVVKTFSTEKILPYGGAISVTFSPDGKYIAFGADNNVALLNVITGLIKTFTGHTSWVTSVAFSPNGKLIVSGSGDKTVKLWNVGTNLCENTFTGHTNVVESVAFSLDGNLIASGSRDGKIVLWNVNTRAPENTLVAGSSVCHVLSVAFSPKSIFAGLNINTIKMWNLKTYKAKKLTTDSSVYSVAISPDRKHIAYSGSNLGTVNLFNPKNNTTKKLTSVGENVMSIAFSPDGKYVVAGISAKEGAIVRLWDVSTGNEVNTYHIFDKHSLRDISVAFNPMCLIP